jgi:hypothetical protein
MRYIATIKGHPWNSASELFVSIEVEPGLCLFHVEFGIYKSHVWVLHDQNGHLFHKTICWLQPSPRFIMGFQPVHGLMKQILTLIMGKPIQGLFIVSSLFPMLQTTTHRELAIWISL